MKPRFRTPGWLEDTTDGDTRHREHRDTARQALSASPETSAGKSHGHLRACSCLSIRRESPSHMPSGHQPFSPLLKKGPKTASNVWWKPGHPSNSHQAQKGDIPNLSTGDMGSQGLSRAGLRWKDKRTLAASDSIPGRVRTGHL